MPVVDLLSCDFELSTLRWTRHRVNRHAQNNGLAELALYRFVVAINEIITNAVRHGGGTGHLRLWRTHDLLCCRVTDHGTGLPVDYRPRRPEPHDTSGRGLWLVHRTVDNLTIETRPYGTTVTLSCFRTPADSGAR
jgi:anti-sigma regulatory factor (Ser/Thr protein kinase)